MVPYLRWLVKLRGGRTEIVYTSDGTKISLYFKLKSPCSINETKYEALIIGFIFALQKEFTCFGHEKILSYLKHVNGEFLLKKITLMCHRTTVQKLIRYFSHFQSEQVQ